MRLWSYLNKLWIVVPLTGMDRDIRGGSGHKVKVTLKPGDTFLAHVPIHFGCPDPPLLTVKEELTKGSSEWFHD